MEVTTRLNNDEFMKQFKYYKSNKPKPSLHNVISVGVNNSKEVNKIEFHEVIKDSRIELLGLKTLKEWQFYTLNRHPGLLFIKNPFTGCGQRYWIRKCLEKYSCKPNRLNIDIDSNLQDWWTECFKNRACDKLLQKKLRWSTLGYHHNWDTKVYCEDNRTPFPDDLAELTDVVATSIGFPNFRPEAAIVNYYHMNSTLSAHTDHSEVNLEAPLFSFSFGQSAIFLIGGKDKTTEPTGIRIDSGDIVIMAKEARLCYHAVPKILPTSDPCWENCELLVIDSDITNLKYISDPKELVVMMNKNVNNQEWSKFRDYITESRINMNIRQVLHENQSNL